MGVENNVVVQPVDSVRAEIRGVLQPVAAVRGGIPTGEGPAGPCGRGGGKGQPSPGDSATCPAAAVGVPAAGVYGVARLKLCPDGHVLRTDGQYVIRHKRIHPLDDVPGFQPPARVWSGVQRDGIPVFPGGGRGESRSVPVCLHGHGVDGLRRRKRFKVRPDGDVPGADGQQIAR